MAETRALICVVVGHVDHGKSSVLDYVRGSHIVAGEAGAITQAIGASIVPMDVIKKKAGQLMSAMKLDFTIPGLLFIDTPGHAAFTNLRKRGGNLADIAIVVVDINEGFKPQTEEAIEILRTYKTPFVIAANKIDLIPGWKSKSIALLQNVNSQEEKSVTKLEEKMYEIVGKLHQLTSLNAERFDRVEDYTKQIAIVPCSAKTGEGIPELLMVVAGLAQKYLEGCLKCKVEGAARGTVLEVKEEKGLGKTMDVIIYDGSLKINDTIVVGGLNMPVVAKVRALFEPMPLTEMRDKKSKFRSVKEVKAATGVKISAPGTEDVVAGMPIRSLFQGEDLEKVKEAVLKEIEEVLIETDKDGIIVKADSLGSLEALVGLLKQKGIAIRKATIGDISRKDMQDAESNFEKDPLLSVILGFNVKMMADVTAPENVKVITNDVIYRLIEEFDNWIEDEKRRQEAKELDDLVRPAKIEIMRGYVFRQNNPAIVGVDILVGEIRTGMPLMKGMKNIGVIKNIQHEKESISRAEKGKQVAVSIDGPTVGRHIEEGDILFSDIPEHDFRKMKELKKHLKDDEKELLKEIATKRREENAVWGV